MTSSRRNPRDVTGRKAVKLAEEHAEALAERSGQISTVHAPDTDFDSGAALPEVSVGTVSVNRPMKKMRVNTDVEDMTFGHGNNLSFKRGVVYTVPVELYDHMEEIGLVYH